MAGFDAGQVAVLLRKIGANDELLANAYVFGSITSDEQDVKTISTLHKAGLLRPDDEPGEFRVTTDFKRMLNRLMRKQSSYRQLTDMGKVIDALDETVKDYHLSVQSKEHDDAEFYLDQLDDLLYETKDGLNTNLDNMHYGIVSQFGFVSTLANKIRQNERYLNHAQSLLTELQQIDPEACYEWINWPCPNEFARKITGFIYWFNQVLPRLRFIIDNMRLSLFRLRRDEKQASQLRNMARFLRQHPEFEINDNLFEDPELPDVLKHAPPMSLSCYVETHNTEHEASLIAIVQALRKQVASVPVKVRDSGEVTLTPVEKVDYQVDFFDQKTEQLFELVISENSPVSAVEFWTSSQVSWQGDSQAIHPKAWIELVFSAYCSLTNEQQDAFDIEMKEVKVAGTSDNYSYSDVVISLK
ncbi:hypothetical protein HWQ46_02400 [Shewanella sp. D64]|uniref:hypothetical protein n=1 Tax=unclassified Shewanella TaxID=196818 RepID=UPI0022BA2B60|nr:MULTISPECIES: hypothetical protein [unclassified Shewanella]MEC4724396.1 hypothetical protein [Shewanella sp. D64]MEC4736827.1 hypothetical protein [Shewanella sp. E94]WBJ94514.1 hypothetical protein HWQ47_22045 [Shewanella sp. MTB7]